METAVFRDGSVILWSVLNGKPVDGIPFMWNCVLLFHNRVEKRGGMWRVCVKIRGEIFSFDYPLHTLLILWNVENGFYWLRIFLVMSSTVSL